MEAGKSVNYILNEAKGIELVICRNSLLSYPIHNHVSVFTVGIVTDGTVKIRLDSDIRLYQKGDTFVIPPYLPHSIQAVSKYSMLSLCIDKGKIESRNIIPEPKTMGISDLREQLELYPERKIGIDEMAQSAFISKYHFIRKFKREVGLTPHQFQIQNKIRKGQRLLHTKEPITEVALNLGFCDQSHFIKHFEKIVGLTPSEYIKSCNM